MKRSNAIPMLLVLAAVAIYALGGCSSDDGVSPHDNPTVSQEDAAGQAAFVSVALVDVLQELAAKAIPQQRFVSGDCVYGSYWRDSDPDHVYTDADHRLILDFDCDGVQDEENNGIVTFNITSIDDVADGTGALTIGDVTVDFELIDVMVEAANYPSGGQVIVSTGGRTATVEFFADHTAQVSVGTRTWEIDLSDGGITEIV